MLDSETKKRIDSARDILVGKLPDPKSQVEQITIALIYKFMDDMDKQSEELGGKTKFFTGEYKKYAWSKIFDSRVSGYELVGLYGEAIQRMNQNPNIHQLFRDIFKNAYLPYRDSETLKSFLKVIAEFEYDHSEKLGDAFEYLLSIMGSQGDAGQFRTPRHIIDFMVKVVDPCKNETILDPACGTAGFLISSFKHIQNKNRNKKDGKINLTPQEKKRLIENFSGYDISPDMVRLSLVNMYLHGFQNPRIYEYDTLTSEDKWQEVFDVILANPPFMSPKGGIKPHKRFSVQAKRSEVLFVDYMAEHLNPNGRAGIIVPEGIIFQSGTAYKKLRKMLVEHSLYAVVSLPAGVFNPYAGVKTSILLLDKSLAKKTDEILFVKINNDGFGLGAQRRPINENDLPLALEILLSFCHSRKSGNPDWTPEQSGEKKLSHLVKKTKIAESGDYNLSGDRYKEAVIYRGKWKMVELGKVCEVFNGITSPRSAYKNKGKIKVIKVKDYDESRIYFDKDEKGWINNEIETHKYLEKGDTLIINAAHSSTHVGSKIGYCAIDPPVKSLPSGEVMIIRPKGEIAVLLLNQMVRSETLRQKIRECVKGIHLYPKDVKQIKIPLPPLEIQEKIVAELDNYQKIIDGAKQVVENYKPTIKIDPSWKMVELRNAPFDIIDGDRGVNYPKHNEFMKKGHCLFLNTKNVREDGFCFDETMFISEEKDKKLRKGKLLKRDVVLTTRGTVGNTGLFDDTVPFKNIRINSGMLICRPDESRILSEYLFYFFQSSNGKKQIEHILSGSAQPQLPIRNLIHLKIPLPPLKIQKQIVAQIDEEQKIVNENKKLIEIFEAKIKDRIAQVWDEK